MRPPRPRSFTLTTRLVLLGLFALAMAELEASAVWYIRAILHWVPAPADLTASAMAQVPGWIVRAEQYREAATMVMLVTIALLMGANWRQRIAAFLYAFAIWDIAYYVWLYVLLSWPPSLTTTDCLFLLPCVWTAPVWFPLLASVAMLLVAAALFRSKKPQGEKTAGGRG